MLIERNNQIHLGIQCGVVLADPWRSKLLDSAAGAVADFHNCIVAGSKFAIQEKLHLQLIILSIFCLITAELLNYSGNV